MKIGQKLKNIKLTVDNNTVLTEKELTGKKVIIYFYPKDDTPGCTTEAIDFTSFKKKFEKLNVSIIGVSKDSILKHSKFIQKHNLKIELAADEDGSLCEMFGVWIEKSMYGKKYMGIERSTFLFDENLSLIYVWKKVKVKNHVQEVFDHISNLS
ncbi:MAG: peroxiredoxin [Alphaproteobacteria bacterium]|nr:peroxiredoxin [Alphaproteobacteria bacterium]